jgi:hypothetical protein
MATSFFCKLLILPTPLCFARVGDVLSMARPTFLKKAFLTTTQHSTPATRRKPSAARKGFGGRGAFRPYKNSTGARIQEGKIFVRKKKVCSRGRKEENPQL